MVYSKIACKFKDDYGNFNRSGLVVNTTPIPVKWRDYLRSNGIVSVYLNLRHSFRKHKQLIKSAILQARSLSNLHCKVIRPIENSYDLLPRELSRLIQRLVKRFEAKYTDQLLQNELEYLFSIPKT